MTMRVPQVAFSAGWLDPLLHAREDFQRHQSGLALCDGFMPLQQGGVTRAPGTQYLGAPLSSTCRLMPFVFANDDVCVLEFTPGKMRVWRYGSLVESSGTPLEVTTPYTTAAEIAALRMTQDADVAFLANGIQPVQQLRRLALDNWTLAEWTDRVGPFRAENTDAAITIQVVDSTADAVATNWTSEASLTIGDTIKAGVRIYEYRGQGATEGAATNGSSGTVLPTHTSGTLSYGYTYDDDDDDATPDVTVQIWWRFLSDTSDNPDFVDLQGVGNPFRASHVGQDFFLTASDWTEIPVWVGNAEVNVGSLLRNGGNVYEVLRQNGAGGTVGTGVNPPVHLEGTVRTDASRDTLYRFVSSEIGVVKVVSVTDANTASAQVIDTVPQPIYDDATYRWAEPAWTSEYGYPATLELYQQRLWAAGTANDPRTVWGSEIGITERFVPGVLDTDAVAYDIGGGGDRSAIQWLFAGRRGLYAATIGSVRLLNPDGGIIAVSTPPANEIVSTVPAGTVPPIAPHGWPIYVSLDGRQMLETRFDLVSEQVRPLDLTLTAQHLSRAGIERMMWQPGAHGRIYARTATDLLTLIYEPEQDVIGWARLPLTGDVLDILAVPGSDGANFDLYLLIKRGTVYAIERMPPLTEVLTESVAVTAYAVAATTLTASPASTSFSVPHLAGQTCAAQADGALIEGLTVAVDGTLTLPTAAASVTVGIVQGASLQTLSLPVPARDGDPRGRMRRLANGLGVHVWNSGGGALCVVTRDRGEAQYHGTNAELLRRPVLQEQTERYTGLLQVDAVSAWATEVSVRIDATGIEPLTVLGVFAPLDEAGA